MDNRIKKLAELYSNGNVSVWIIHCALNGPREKVNLDCGILSKRNKKGKTTTKKGLET